MQQKTEYELIVEFRAAKETVNKLKDELSIAVGEFDKAESQLVERLQNEGKDATARYDGLGFVSLYKPQLYASCAAENKESLFKFLRARKRQDLIQKTVHPSSLSTYVRELVENGRKVPVFISYYLKQSARFYAEKEKSNV